MSIIYIYKIIHSLNYHFKYNHVFNFFYLYWFSVLNILNICLKNRKSLYNKKIKQYQMQLKTKEMVEVGIIKRELKTSTIIKTANWMLRNSD